MSYKPTEWTDHFEDASGTVTVGTPMDAKNFNHMEQGIEVANKQQIRFYRDEEGFLCYENAEDVDAEEYYGGDDG